jgi:integrase
MEALRLRVKDVDFERRMIAVREDKVGKDRFVMLVQAPASPLRAQLAAARAVCGADRAADRPGVELPGARADKYPRTPHRDRGPPGRSRVAGAGARAAAVVRDASARQARDGSSTSHRPRSAA